MARVNTGVLSDGLSGTVGNTVFVQTANGVVARPRITPHDPHTPAQAAMRAHFTRAAAAYRSLSVANATLWKNYAAAQRLLDPRYRTARTVTAYAAFTGLTTKFLQVSPAGAIPQAPPAFGFIGDLFTVTATGAHGGLFFAGHGSNSAGVVTELLIQPLKFAHQAAPLAKFRTQTFTIISSDTGPVEVFARAGWYAPAYRFVNAATGQESPIVRLPAVLVS